MSSGFGLKGTQGRCYPFWSSFYTCIQETDDKALCRDMKDDYVECLHHGKEFKRVREVNEVINKVRELEAQPGGLKPGGGVRGNH